jgi:hypothetical protein
MNKKMTSITDRLLEFQIICIFMNMIMLFIKKKNEFLLNVWCNVTLNVVRVMNASQITRLKIRLDIEECDMRHNMIS